MGCGEAAIIGLIVAGILTTAGYVVLKRLRWSKCASSPVLYDLPERPPAAYRLEWADPPEVGNGIERGICVVRTADNRCFQWEDLPEGFLSVLVSGTRFRKVALQSNAFAPGKTLSLIPEPHNPHDPSAIGVWDQAGRTQIGFIPRNQAPTVGSMIRGGTLAGCVSMCEQFEGHARVALRILIIRNGLDIG